MTNNWSKQVNINHMWSVIQRFHNRQTHDIDTIWAEYNVRMQTVKSESAAFLKTPRFRDSFCSSTNKNKWHSYHE